MTTATRYDTASIAMHWTTAILVVALWGTAQIIDAFPPWGEALLRSVHVTGGILLALVLLARLAWRLSGARVPPPVDPGLLGRAAGFVHLLLYGLVAATVAIGIGYALLRGDLLFWVVQVPSIAPGDRALRRLVRGWHETAANAVLIVAGLHALAALAHHFLLRDGTLRRMLPQR